ncbi:MAG TPA: glycosyltransferase 87 family protein [Candidatus Limnocylindria bacterium]
MHDRQRISPVERVARTVVLAVSLAWLAYVLASWFLVWDPADAGAYYDAAARLRDGLPLYQPMNPEAHEVYRYAPWFAYAWIPVTVLPRDVALHAWSFLMLVASGVAVWPIVRLGTVAAVSLAALLGAFLAETAMFGNAHPAVVALMVVTATRRSFPIWLGVAASIKLVPIAFVLVWLGRRQWGPALVALVTVGILWLHAAFFDLGGYVTDPGTGLLSLYAVSPVLWIGVAVTATGLAVVMAASRSRYSWIATAALAFIGPPRVVLSYLAFLAPAVVLTLRERDR